MFIESWVIFPFLCLILVIWFSFLFSLISHAWHLLISFALLKNQFLALLIFSFTWLFSISLFLLLLLLSSLFWGEISFPVLFVASWNKCLDIWFLPFFAVYVLKTINVTLSGALPLSYPFLGHPWSQ